jgi:predicted RNA-binding Zn-ribbon protein involved in translation (DUF1610 family)
MKMWESRAKYVEQVFGGYVDWEERFYECPECHDAIYECDWDEKLLSAMICPICGFHDEEGEEDF